jgi:hypothetical protein
MKWFRKWWGQDDAHFNEYLGLPHLASLDAQKFVP